jgi:hypothetical protein
MCTCQLNKNYFNYLFYKNVQTLQRNWQRGNFKRMQHYFGLDSDPRELEIDDDYVVSEMMTSDVTSFEIIDKRSLRLHKVT